MVCRSGTLFQQRSILNSHRDVSSRRSTAGSIHAQLEERHIRLPPRAYRERLHRWCTGPILSEGGLLLQIQAFTFRRLELVVQHPRLRQDPTRILESFLGDGRSRALTRPNSRQGKLGRNQDHIFNDISNYAVYEALTSHNGDEMWGMDFALESAGDFNLDEIMSDSVNMFQSILSSMREIWGEENDSEVTS